MLNTHKILIFIIILNCFSCRGVQEGQSTRDGHGIDSSMRYGRLPNGFTYFIKSIQEPQKKLFLRFYNKAGSNQQDQDQLDVAHGVEHLAFRETENFPEGIGNNSVIKEIGMGIYDYYAYSGNRNTEYYFDAPNNSMKALEVGLLWFKDIANGLKLSLSDIEQVKGELRQEKLESIGDLLSSHSASSELRAKLFPCQENNSKFLKHYENANPEIFRRFYKDWYRPELLAISIVGNVENLDALENRIKDTFSDLKSPKSPRIVRDCDYLFYDRAPQFHIVERSSDLSKIHTDEKVALQMIFRDPETMHNFDKPMGIERLTMLRMLREVMIKRLNEAIEGYKSFDVGVKDTYKYDNLPVNLLVKAELKNNTLEDSVRKIMKVLRQLQKYGITESEWNELIQNQFSYLNSVNEESARYWLDTFAEFYSCGETFPAGKLARRKEQLDNLTLVEFNKYTQQFLSKRPKDLGLIVPEGHPLLSLKETDMRSWIEDEFKNDIEPYESPNVPESLMSPVKISKLNTVEVVNKKIGESGAHEFLFENGVKLIFKPFKPNPGTFKDKIKIHGFALKGASCFPKEDFFSAVYAPYIIGNSGVNNLNKFEINRFLSEKKISPSAVSSYIDANESGIMGSVSLKNLEIILQLIYLHFTNPNKDKRAFEDWETGKLNSDIDARQWDFRNSVKKIMGDDSVVPLMILGTKSLQRGTELYEGIEKIDLNTSYDIYKNIFDNVEDFTFVVSGDFDLNAVFPLLAKYLGNLPSVSRSSRDCESQKPKVSLPSGPELREISAIGNYDMPNIKYIIKFLENAPVLKDWKEQLRVEALGGVATQIAWGLRFKQNYSLYNIGVGGKFNHEMNRYEIASQFDCVPEEFSMIRKEVLQIFEDIKSGKISEEDFQKGMARMFSFYNSEGKIGFHFMLHQNLYKHYRYGQPWVEPEEIESFVKSITIDDITQTAGKYIKEKNRYEFVMQNKEIK